MNSVNRAGQGWWEVAISGGPHLERILQMYQELGFEVHLEEVMPGEQQCLNCYEKRGETPYVVYVRSRDEAGI
jgi:hypothetical protein